MIQVMPREKNRAGQSEPPKTGRQQFKYVGLPLEVYEAIKAFADEDDRTVPGIVKRACREYIKRHKPGEGEPS